MSLNLRYAFREGLLGLKRTRLSSILTVSTIAVTLTLFGLFMAVTYNLRRMVSHIREQILLEVFVDPTLDTPQTEQLGFRIGDVSGVAESIYVSRDEALSRFKSELGEDPMAILGENPLPASFQVRVAETHRSSEAIDGLAQALEALNGVDEVMYKGRLFELVNRYSVYVYLVDGVLFFLVLVASVFLVANTLRLTILSQKKIIQIMELVGATRGFIRRPYLILGMIQGAMGGVFAVASVMLVVALVNLQFDRLILVPWLLYAGLWALGVGLAFWGSRIGLHRHLQAP